jgi:hypothetical protein
MMTTEQLQAVMRAISTVPPKTTRKGRKTLVRMARRFKRELGRHDACAVENIFRTNDVRKQLQAVKRLMFKLDHGESVELLSFVAASGIRDQLSKQSIARKILKVS